ncbi:glutamate receptor-interacting protein 2-like isoform X2 [Sycon ciliatum]|uniref:glutamate receptor-interacting protein 2-like isoform X2 n=1 Tax=Sycon ciliatum TaxID=27933 RepID=UPI0031F6AE1D
MSTESMVRSPDSSGSSRPAGGGLRRSNGMPRWENEARHLLFQKAPRIASLSQQLSTGSGLGEATTAPKNLARHHSANEHDLLSGTTSFKHTQYSVNRSRRNGLNSPVTTSDHDGRKAAAATASTTMPATKKHQISYVELVRQKGEALGIIISGGSDRNQPVTITHLKGGSIAKRSEALEVGDQILAVNGTGTKHLRHQDIVGLLLHAGALVSLEIEYETSPDDPSNENNLRKKTVSVTLKREGDGFGFKLRGGEEEGRGRLLTFAHVQPGSDGYGQGLIKIGDRLLTINYIDVTRYSVSAAMALLKKCKSEVTLDVQYDVTIQDGIQGSNPLVVELTKSTGVSLGITLSGSHLSGDPIFISHVRDGGIADRCGALHAGDRLLAINGRSLESCSLPDAVQLLLQSGNTVRLEVIPGSQENLKAMEEALASGGMKTAEEPLPPPPLDLLVDDPMELAGLNHHSGMNGVEGTPTSAGYGSGLLGDSMATPTEPLAYTPDSSMMSIASSTLQQQPLQNNRGHHQSVSSVTTPRRPSKVVSMGTPAHPTLQRKMTSMLICRQETMEVELKSDSYGFGFALQSVHQVYMDGTSFMISSMEADGPADRLCVLQIGDSVVKINGTSTTGMTVEQACDMIRHSGGTVVLTAEFDVAEGVVPSAGLFDVKLLKQGRSLGITINGGMEDGIASQLWVSQVKKGGVAYRSGMLQAGDYLIAVNGKSVDGLTLTQAAELLKTDDEFVTLQIKKDPRIAGSSDSVVLTVEISRHGENLGITLNGSNIAGEPIYVARVKEDGVAYKTGALLEGDVLLSINGHSLRDSNLEETVDLLLKAGDNITFRISRAAKKPLSSSDAAEANLEVFNITSSSPSKPPSRRPSKQSSFTDSQWSPEDKVFYSDNTSAAAAAVSAARGGPANTEQNNGDVRSENSISPFSIRTLGDTPTPTHHRSKTPQQAAQPDSSAIFQEAKRLQEQWQGTGSGSNHSRYTAAPQRNGFHNAHMKLSRSIEHIEHPTYQPFENGDQHRRPVVSEHAKTRYDQQSPQAATYAKVSKPPVQLPPSSSQRSRILTDPSAAQSPYSRYLRNRPQQARSLTGLNSYEEFGRHHPQAGSTFSLTFDRDTGPSPVQHAVQRQYEPSNRSHRHRPSSSSSRRSVTPTGNDEQADSGAAVTPVYAEATYSSGRPPPLPPRNTPLSTQQPLQYHHIELYRHGGRSNGIAAGFGFSVSDGKEFPGVFVRALQPNGIAERSGKLFPFDRIIEVNNYDVRNWDCRRTLPLLAEAGSILKLVICRSMVHPVLQ